MSYDKKSFSEGLKNIYYTPMSAVADLIDNSIDAKAKNIDIYFWNGKTPYVAIIDDGEGMSSKGLEYALDIKQNETKQNKLSLGKFGWGLKTATFSQAKLLTVITQKNNQLISKSMNDNFDKIEEGKNSIFKKFQNIEQYTKKRFSNSGTAIIWSDLGDQILGRDITKNNKRSHGVFYKIGNNIAEYISMCFHNYLKDTNIYFNGEKIKKINPFFEVEGLKKFEPIEIPINDSRIIIEGVLYPKQEDMDEDLYENLSCIDGWNQSQGIYIYRENRLIDFGGWFDLNKSGRSTWKNEEKFNRCRIALKYDSTLDNVFKPNVQKSRTQIPNFLRHKIAEYCDTIRKECILRTRNIAKNNETESNLDSNNERVIKRDENKNLFIDYSHPLVDEFINKTVGRNRKQFLLEKILKDLKNEHKENLGFFRKLLQ